MLTLTEAAKLTNDVLLKGIIETIITESDLLKRLPFQDIKGNGLTYNRETTLPEVEFYDVGDIMEESSGTYTQATATLKRLGGNVDFDEFELQTMSDINDVKATGIEEKAKAMARAFNRWAVYGNNTTNAKQFDGMHKMCDSTMVVNQGSTATGAPLKLSNLDAMIDKFPGSGPDALMMNKTMQRLISQFYRASGGSSYHLERGEDGKMVAMYGDLPIIRNDFITFTETISSSTFATELGGATTSIFGVKFGPKLLSGLQNKGIQKKEIGDLESKDALRWRIKWYVSMALFNKYGLARVDGITNAAVVAGP